jgi:hypothetical protein
MPHFFIAESHSERRNRVLAMWKLDRANHWGW